MVSTAAAASDATSARFMVLVFIKPHSCVMARRLRALFVNNKVDSRGPTGKPQNTIVINL